MKFSILTSIHAWHPMKMQQLKRCYESLLRQSFEDWEMILVDDGSPNKIQSGPVSIESRIKIYNVEHLERINALREAMKQASGEWMVFLDADDEFFPHSLEAMNQMIEKNPDYKMFNYESFHVRRDFTSWIRGAFKPEKKDVGHEVFGGGNIVNGTFVFHRSIYEDLGGYPKYERMWSPWEFSITAQKEFPEIQQYFMVDHEDEPDKIAKELGNPWGNDFYLFYKYTRKYHSKPYDIPLIMIHHEGKSDGERHELKG